MQWVRQADLGAALDTEAFFEPLPELGILRLVTPRSRIVNDVIAPPSPFVGALLTAGGSVVGHRTTSTAETTGSTVLARRRVVPAPSLYEAVGVKKEEGEKEEDTWGGDTAHVGKNDSDGGFGSQIWAKTVLTSRPILGLSPILRDSRDFTSQGFVLARCACQLSRTS